MILVKSSTRLVRLSYNFDQYKQLASRVVLLFKNTFSFGINNISLLINRLIIIKELFAGIEINASTFFADSKLLFRIGEVIGVSS